MKLQSSGRLKHSEILETFENCLFVPSKISESIVRLSVSLPDHLVIDHLEILT